METLLRRYTELPFVIDFLRTEELALLNPESWDDRNDSFYIEEFARQTNAHAVYALCLADCAETYHHWRVFSHGSGGACIQFKKKEFLAALANVPRLKYESVRYRTIKELRATPPTNAELPFLKRYAFKHEGEFRLFYSSDQEGPSIHRIAVPRTSVDRIVLSPWLPQSVADHVKATIKGMPKCSTVKVYRSTLVDNEQWKNFANAGT